MVAFVVKWIPSLEMDTVTRVQILDESVYIAHSTHTLGKCINRTILSSDKGNK